MIKLYNILFRKKQIFKPIHNKQVGLYTCGPTVYDFVHIGNLRTYIFEDILRKTLKYNNYKIKHIMNITDVEDKIIKRAKKENKNIKEITEFFTDLFFKDIKKLNIEKAEFYPRATKHIKEMIVLIETLIKKGFAYQGKDKSIYFDISKFKNYGKLSQLKKRKIKTGARIVADEYNKDEAQDFVLWKAKKGDEPFWQSPFGKGRPGWHIECSAMAMKYLGKTFDIHCGAVDLIFPHHENEIAQSEAATGKKFVNYWIEGEHLLVDNKKMSKSLNNFYTLRDLENKNFNPLAFRYLILTSHYRSKLNFSWKSLEAAQNALNNLYNEIKQINIDKTKTNTNKKTSLNIQKQYKSKFLSAINDDLNTAKTISIVWQIIKDKKLINKEKKQLLTEFDKILSLGLNKVKTIKIPPQIKALASKREKLRVNKQFIQADRLRKKLEQLGYLIEDTPQGPKVMRNSKFQNPNSQ
ncbi:cysteine--tRNA ligase [Candidatus Wolfebacteria bacterium]|nr:cysteine--tRNA ligase [Candidatus Wolfebacteria bacterium]